MSQPAFDPAPADQVMRSLNAAAEQGRDFLDAAVHTCAAGMEAFFQDLARNDAEAASEVVRCRTPLELLAVQQKWLAGRAEACMSAGVRMCVGVLHEPEAAAAQAGAWRLPE